MRTLLLLNPNTDPGISERLRALAQVRAPAGLQVRAATARLGAAYIGSEAAAALAAHATLDAWAADLAVHGAPDAVLLACFGDPGLHALRALSAVPVLGLAEASMQAAAALGPFVVLTGGAAWVPMLQRFALTLDLPQPMLGVHAVAPSGGSLAAAPESAAALLAQAATEALARWPAARSVLLGGAGLVGLATAVAGAVPVPVLCSVELALQAAFAAARTPPATCGPAAHPGPGPWRGLSPELLGLLQCAPASNGLPPA
jgi:allantoin racemase